MDNKEVLDRHLRDVELRKVHRKELDILHSTINRTKSILHIRKIEIAEPTFPPTDLPIGLLSREVDYWAEGGDQVHGNENSELKFARLDDFYQITIPNNVNSIESAQLWLYEKIEKMAKQGVKLIVCNELAYPSFKTPAGHMDEDQLLEGDNALRGKLQKLSNDYDAIILAGTYHDAEELTNKAMIFFPNYGLIEHKKLTAAKSRNVGEVIRTRADNNFEIYETGIGLITVLICMDAYDLNTFFRYVLSNIPGSVERRAEIVIVPSYTPKPLNKACKELSYTANCIVVYVDQKAGENNAVYLSGEEIFSQNSSDEFGIAHLSGTFVSSRRRQRKYSVFSRDGTVLPV